MYDAQYAAYTTWRKAYEALIYDQNMYREVKYDVQINFWIQLASNSTRF